MESELAAQIANTPHGRTLGFLPEAPPVYDRGDFARNVNSRMIRPT